MSVLKEFKEFAMRGNVVDLAVGIIIGASFGKIVSALVEFVIMPPLGMIIGGVDFSDLAFTLRAAEGDTAAIVVGYGKFIQTVFDFTIVAFAIFMVVKFINKIKRADAAEAPKAATPEDVLLLREIRDALKADKKVPVKAPSKKK